MGFACTSAISARKLGIAWGPFFPLGSAFDFLPKVTDRPAVRTAAAAQDVTPAQIALAWLLAHAPNVLLIPGTADPVHLTDNMAIGSITVDECASPLNVNTRFDAGS